MLDTPLKVIAANADACKQRRAAMNHYYYFGLMIATLKIELSGVYRHSKSPDIGGEGEVFRCFRLDFRLVRNNNILRESDGNE